MNNHLLDIFLRHNPEYADKIVEVSDWGLAVLRIELNDGRTILWDEVHEIAKIYEPGNFDIKDTNRIRSEFASWFNVLVQNHGKTVDEISRISGLSKAIIYRYLSGEAEPTYRNILLLSKTLGCDPADFFHSVREFDFVN